MRILVLRKGTTQELEYRLSMPIESGCAPNTQLEQEVPVVRSLRADESMYARKEEGSDPDSCDLKLIHPCQWTYDLWVS